MAALIPGTVLFARSEPRQPRVGDIVFQHLSGSPLMEAIAGITESSFTHCGIISGEDADGLKIIEAIGPVREIAFDAWMANGSEGGLAVFRLRQPYRSLIPAILEHVRAQLGKPYDIRYRFDDARVYCSELIFKAFWSVSGEALGEVKALHELNWKPYAAFIRSIEQGPVPLDRRMITPVDLARAKQLEYVFHRRIELGAAREGRHAIEPECVPASRP